NWERKRRLWSRYVRSHDRHHRSRHVARDRPLVGDAYSRTDQPRADVRDHPGRGAVVTAEWFPALASVALFLFLLTWRNPTVRSRGSARTQMALLCNVRPLWGETDASVRERLSAASRWPYLQPAPR